MLFKHIQNIILGHFVGHFSTKVLDFRAKDLKGSLEKLGLPKENYLHWASVASTTGEK